MSKHYQLTPLELQLQLHFQCQLHYSSSTALQLQLQLQLLQLLQLQFQLFNYTTTTTTTPTTTTLQLQQLQQHQLHYSCNYNCYNYGCNYIARRYTALHLAIVGEVIIATTPIITTTFRFISGFALPSMHHNNFPIGFLSLKFPPPPCAVLLVWRFP